MFLVAMVAVGLMFVGVAVCGSADADNNIMRATIGRVMLLGSTIACSVVSFYHRSYEWGALGVVLAVLIAVDLVRLYHKRVSKKA